MSKFTRRYVVLGVLAIALFAGGVVWAYPKIDRLLNPPKPAAIGTCTERAVGIGSISPIETLAAAKKSIGRSDITIEEAAWIWHRQNNRLELWLITAEEIWQLEFVCFEIVTPGQKYVAQFGEVRVDSIKSMIEWDKGLKAAEAGE